MAIKLFTTSVFSLGVTKRVPRSVKACAPSGKWYRWPTWTKRLRMWSGITRADGPDESGSRARSLVPLGAGDSRYSGADGSRVRRRDGRIELLGSCNPESGLRCPRRPAASCESAPRTLVEVSVSSMRSPLALVERLYEALGQ